ELNAPAYQGATILVAERNFGCGSSREHAPWALLDYGFRAILAPSFADIFYNNCFKNGILPVVLPLEAIQQIIQRAQDDPGFTITVDLERRVVEDDGGHSLPFEVDDFRRKCLLEGLDDIGLSLQYEDAIRAYEEKHGIAA